MLCIDKRVFLEDFYCITDFAGFAFFPVESRRFILSAHYKELRSVVCYVNAKKSNVKCSKIY